MFALRAKQSFENCRNEMLRVLPPGVFQRGRNLPGLQNFGMLKQESQKRVSTPDKKQQNNCEGEPKTAEPQKTFRNVF